MPVYDCDVQFYNMINGARQNNCSRNHFPTRGSAIVPNAQIRIIGQPIEFVTQPGIQPGIQSVSLTGYTYSDTPYPVVIQRIWH